MTVRKYSSRSQQTTLTAALTSTATTMSVVSGSALMGGKTLTGSQTYTVVIDPDTALEEIVDVTLYSSGNTITITRNIDGSTGQAHSAGAVVRHMAIGRDYQEANDHIEQTTGTAHGLALADVVEVTDTGTVSTTMLAANAVTTAKITDANVTAAKLASDSVTTAKIADSAVTTGKIADGTIVNADINAAAAIDKTKVSGTAITAADTGTVNATILANLAVTTAKLVDANVTTAKIADVNVTTAKIADSAVTSAKIADLTIVDGDISTSAAIAKTKISGTAITAADTGTVTSTMIADGTIVNADINAAAAIALSKLATDPLARANHTGTQTASTISDFDTQVRTNRLDQMAAPTAAVPLNAQKLTGVADPTLAQDASTKAYVDAQITALVGGAPGTLNTLDEIAAAINDSGTFATSVVLRDGTQAMTGALAMGTNKITGLGTPTTSTDAATKAYADTMLPLAGGTMSGAIAMGTNKITGVGNPTNAQDVVTKNYLDTTVLAPSNLTGPITSSGAATSIASQTGTGTKFVVDNSPTIITPIAVSSSTTTVPLVLRGIASQTADLLQIQNSSNTAVAAFTSTGNLVVGQLATTNATIEVGSNRTVDGNALIDLVGDTTYTDYGLRIIRGSGANGASYLQHRGTGTLALITQDAAAISFATSNTTRMRINSDGVIGFGNSGLAGSSFCNTVSTAASGAAYNSFYTAPIIASDATGVYRGYFSIPSTEAAAFTLGALRHFQANGVTLGAGSAVTNQFGFYAENNITTAANNFGFYGNIAAASGRWNFFAQGTAGNYFAGRVGIGTLLTNTAMAAVFNTTAADIGFLVRGAASQTGDLQQWQNSAGTTLAEVTASGGFELNGKDIELMTIMQAL